jgi:phenylalanyl-tRNA synthetase alpha chain
MKDQIAQIQAQALAKIGAAASPAALEEARIHVLGRNGSLPALMAGLKDVSPSERPEIGKLCNELKQRVTDAFEARKAALEDAVADMPFDSTLPGRAGPSGSLHPVNQVRDRCIAIFRRLGFALASGPDIETEWHNFDALNTPPDHPARNEQDTFYIDPEGLAPASEKHGRWLLRTHTSPVQIRTMLAQKPPIRIIAPGRCYRRDEIDATHGMSFTQMEGLAVDENITAADLKGTLERFFRELLGRDLKFRFRPHFFPFTEPSFEVDCSRPGAKVRGKEWLEICGCGMVDPAVFHHVGIDPERYTGWAFGFGIDRLVMILHGIPDLRLFSENDVRFLRQFS